MNNDSDYQIRLATLEALGGDITKEYDSVYSIDLEILRLTEQGGGGGGQGGGTTYTAGQNISINSSNAISAEGYIFDSTIGGFAEKYKQDNSDGGQIVVNTATGLGSHAEGYNTAATGGYGSHAEGNMSTASGYVAHAEGNRNTASGTAAHAEGNKTTASGDDSHTEGTSTVASGNNSHAEGLWTLASGYFSHAEGQGSTNVKNTASGKASHVEGSFNTAQNFSEHAEGAANVSHRTENDDENHFGNAGNTIHSIGIGRYANSRKNATEVMQNGDYYLYGVGGYQGTDTKVLNASIKTVQEVINGKADIYEIATLADIEALFVMPTFYIDSSLYKTYGNLNWAQWLSSKYNTANYTHIYNASLYDSTIEQIPEVNSSAYPIQNGQYYSYCDDTAATGPADNEIWYTTESGNLWEPTYDFGNGLVNTLNVVNNNYYGSEQKMLSNTYVNGHGVIKYSEPIFALNYNFGINVDNTDLTTLTLPHGDLDNNGFGVYSILGNTTPQLEAIYYNGTVAECEEISWSEYDSNSANGIDEIICLDGTYSLSDEGGGDYGGGGGY